MADLAQLLRLPGAADALRAIERELFAGKEGRFPVSLVLEALAGWFVDSQQLEQELQILARRDSSGTAAVRLLISLCGVDQAIILSRLSSPQKGGAHG